MISPVNVVVALSLAFGFLNGFHDSANIVATVISSRSLASRQAMMLAAISVFLGPFLFGVAVAKTIGSELVDPGAITLSVILAALLSAIIWNLGTWAAGIPSSSSHALIGGILGAAIANGDMSVVQISGLIKVLAALFFSPMVGLAGGYLAMKVILFLARDASPKVNWFFKRMQIFTTIALGLSHGTNDGQKTMAILVMGLMAAGTLPTFTIPFWVVISSATVMGLGMGLGGWRIIRTLGMKFYKIRPVDGFTSQTTSAVIVLGAALMGGPVSTTQVVSTSILGVGSAERANKVRWGVAIDIALTWLLTIPATMALSALLYLPIEMLLQRGI